jgi:hypothetical protein
MIMNFASVSSSGGGSSEIREPERIDGILTGDLNVAKATSGMALVSDSAFAMEISNTESKSLTTLVAPCPPLEKMVTNLAYSVEGGFTQGLNGFEVLQVKAVDEESIERKSKFQFFAMNLRGLRIPLLSGYSVFVAVYKQIDEVPSSVVVIDKRGKSLELAHATWQPYAGPVALQASIMRVACVEFKGAVSDTSVTAHHRKLLTCLDSEGLIPISRTNYRVLVTNQPRTFSSFRSNKLCIDLEP